MDMQKAGPVFPATFSRVVFRIVGETQLRVFDPRHSIAKHLDGVSLELVYRNFQAWCQTFVDMRCRPLVRLDGYNPQDKSFKKAEVIGKLEVDMFYCDHPEVK